MNSNSTSNTVAELVQAAKSGDENAKSELIRRYRGYLVIIARRMIGQKLQRRLGASDIVQQTCAEAWKDIEGFRGVGEAEFTAWVAKILRRNLANQIRDNSAGKRDLRKEVAADGTASVFWHGIQGKDATPSKNAIEGEMALQLANAVEDLPHGQRDAVRMRHLEGKTLAEISNCLGKSDTAVAGLIKRGLQTLRKTMDSAE